MLTFKFKFKKVGENVIFDPFSTFTYQNIEIGNDVYIGQGAYFVSPESIITLGNKVMFGPYVSILGGDHNTTVVGEYMFDVKQKLPENDLPVVIEDDVWIGGRVIILKGITIGTGSIIAAGSIVTKNVEPYSIMAGIPAKKIRQRFDNEITLNHHVSKLSLKSDIK